jgi:hypothetical protein
MRSLDQIAGVVSSASLCIKHAASRREIANGGASLYRGVSGNLVLRIARREREMQHAA